jgi:hypothetical protein
MSQYFHPHSYLIIGCGRFGSRAAEKLFQRNSHSKIIVVDKSKQALQKVSHLPIAAEVCDAVSYLHQFLSEGQKADYIIPAVPLHLVFEFVLSQLKPLGAKKRRSPTFPGLPNPMMGKTGDLYTSLADFLCSEDCPEPARYCKATGKKRGKPLYQMLKDLKGPFESRVIRSFQLAPGVGGFKPEALLDLLEDIKKKKNSCRFILISTASRCHGVTSFLSISVASGNRKN